MITRTLLCLTLLFLVCKHQANSRYRARIDSLKQVLRQNPHDTIRIDNYSDLGKYYATHLSMLDSAIAYTDSAWQLAEKLDYQTGKMLATLSYAYIDKEKSDYKLALSRFQEYVDYWHTKGDSVEMANGLYGMGLIYNYLGDLAKNIEIQFRILNFSGFITQSWLTLPMWLSIYEEMAAILL